jgi:hypothetical protein
LTPALLFLFAGALSAALVLAQYAKPVNSGGQVNPQVNTALYGGGTTNSSVRYNSSYGTSMAMGSEFRYASWTSGALPSEVRGGYAKLGPIAPSGPMAYIPPANASYMPQPKTTPPSAIGSSAYGNSSIRYSTPAAAPTASYIAPKSMSTPVSPSLVSRGPINSGPINTGAIRYGP